MLKLVNASAEAQPLRLEIAGGTSIDTAATKTVIQGEPMAVNDAETGSPVRPVTSPATVGKSFTYDAPAHSFTVLRLRTSTEGQ